MTPHASFPPLAIAGLLLVAFLSGPARASLPPVVGEATLVIGASRLIGADGAPRELQRGAGLRVGDRIETQGGAHVHIRFVDGGLISIRPGSRLVVEQYAAPSGAAGATQGAIKFRLEEGVVRSITGAWGEAARERFRLNTPVAAIGVKGTDFVVRSAGESTAASVYTGAIVVAPLTGACVATVGPCSNGAEKLLSADMKGQMLELHRNQATPRLVPAVDLMAMARAGAAEARGAAAEVRPAATADPRPAAEPRPAASAGSTAVAAAPATPAVGAAEPRPALPPGIAGTVSAAVGNVVAAVEARLIGSGAPPSAEAAAVAAVVAARSAVEAAAAHTAAEALAQATAAKEAAARVAAEAAALAAAQAAAREAAARAAAEAAALAAAQAAAEQLARRNSPEQALGWVAFPWAAALAGDDFSRRFDAALLAGTRSVATDGAFSLRRPEATVFAPQDATASFRLTNAAALVARDRGLTLENVQIANGSLDVDFARSTFATSMTATGPVLGSALVQASGGIDAAGAMRSTAGNASVVGGFNGDGHKAGLSFRREVPGGVLQGITLWGR